VAECVAVEAAELASYDQIEMWTLLHVNYGLRVDVQCEPGVATWLQCLALARNCIVVCWRHSYWLSCGGCNLLLLLLLASCGVCNLLLLLLASCGVGNLLLLASCGVPTLSSK
jgi:hypothetical protein